MTIGQRGRGLAGPRRRMPDIVIRGAEAAQHTWPPSGNGATSRVPDS